VNSTSVSVRTLVPLLCALGSGGCLYLKPAWTPDDTGWIPPDTYHECPLAECSYTFTIDMPSLEDCYYDDLSETWSLELPEELESCTAFDDTCEVMIGPWAVRHPDCCLPETEEEALEECCSDVSYNMNEDGELAVSTFIEDVIQVDCPVTYDGNDSCAIPGGAEPVNTEEECEDRDVQAFQAEFELQADIALSWLEFTPPGGPAETVDLRGIAGAATGPKRFVTGLFFADDVSIGSFAMTDPRLNVDGDVMVAANGTSFTVPVNQQFRIAVAGSVGGQDLMYRLTPTAAATGVLDVGAGYWELDYTTSDTFGDIVVHLEGAAVAICVP
jgi:hypothetical protein